jgi:hypothetical protein
MILKGSQRAGGADLALHLMNAFDNERIELGQVRGTVADDLHGAFGEYDAIAAGTRCEKHLYSLSINPPAPLTRQQYLAAVDRIEKGLGLAGQPRAIVFHVKNGREHCHVVWSRIDSRNLRAVHISHDRMKLRTLARELAREFGLPLPEGLARDLRDQNGPKRDITLAEKRQAELTGITPEERRAVITAAFRASDTAEAFRAALAQHGYVLAQGDRRGFVVVDRFGDVHSLARQIEGIKTGALKQRLHPLTPDQLPGVDEARAMMRERNRAREDAIRARVKERLSDALKALEKKQAARRQAIEQRRQTLLTVQAAERMELNAAQRAELQKPFTRAAIRMFALIARVPALRSVLGPIIRNPALNPKERHAQERAALHRRHEREKRLTQRRLDVLKKLEARERTSLKASLTRNLRDEERLRHDPRHDQSVAKTQDEGAPILTATFAASSGWKQRQQKLAEQRGAKRSHPKGYRLKRDGPDEP